MRYRFRLERVLRVRRTEEKSAKEAVQHLNSALVRAIETRDLARERYLVAEESMADDLETLLTERTDAELAALVLVHAERDVSRVASEAALAHLAWQRAARRVEALERLDERRRREYAEEEARREVSLVDDVVSARYTLDRLNAIEEAFVP